MIKKILGLFLGVVYSVSSNTFFHVSSMGHFFSFENHGSQVEAHIQPCHEDAEAQLPQNSDDCFDHCMGAYDDFGGVGGVQSSLDGIHDSSICEPLCFNFIDGYVLHPGISYKIIDPPNVSGGGRSVVGQDRKKRE